MLGTTFLPLQLGCTRGTRTMRAFTSISRFRHLFLDLSIFFCVIKLFYHLNPLFLLIFQGFAIGNGLTDPAIQYKAYTDYALDMGLITESEFNKINKIVPVCEFAVKLCGNYSWTRCLLVCNKSVPLQFALLETIH